MADVIYTPNDILEQEFKTKMRGYDPIEVDEFLDNIIKDYETYGKEIADLKAENEQLKAKVQQAEKSVEPAPSRVKEVPKSSAVTNFDILKRLSNLEREVFGKKLDQQQHVQATRTSANDDFKNNYSQADDDDNEKTRQF
ncbi:cell division regulator GpsB [Enterococcus sp. CSURQ0835]|uniref:cell division regulator GpsB n=1 Tax=Enterococcus sp. CSURQ0835 TaxID=2681394 RepID=UPI001359CB0F|nr:cell division regulator GpsB [Enterococcus sp. CSURQ0835]